MGGKESGREGEWEGRRSFVMSNKWSESSFLQEQLQRFIPVCACTYLFLHTCVSAVHMSMRLIVLRERSYVWVSLNAGGNW